MIILRLVSLMLVLTMASAAAAIEKTDVLGKWTVTAGLQGIPTGTILIFQSNDKLLFSNGSNSWDMSYCVNGKSLHLMMNESNQVATLAIVAITKSIFVIGNTDGSRLELTRNDSTEAQSEQVTILGQWTASGGGLDGVFFNFKKGGSVTLSVPEISGATDESYGFENNILRLHAGEHTHVSELISGSKIKLVFRKVHNGAVFTLNRIWAETTPRNDMSSISRASTPSTTAANEEFVTMPTSNANRGTVFVNQKDYDRGIVDCTRAIELDPKSATAYANRGAAFIDQKDYDRGIVDCTRAIELDPKFATAYANRGAAFIDQKDYDRGIVDCTRAIELDPKFAAAYANRGAAFIDQKDYDRGIVDCTRAIELNPNFAAAFANRGAAFINQKNYDRGIVDCTRAIELNPKFAAAYANRGNAYNQVGQTTNAERDCRLADMLKKQSP